MIAELIAATARNGAVLQASLHAHTRNYYTAEELADHRSSDDDYGWNDEGGIDDYESECYY